MIKLELIVVTLDWVSGKYYVLLNDKKEPISDICGESPDSMIKKLCKEYLNLSPSFLDCDILGCRKENSIFVVSYNAICPLDLVPPKGLNWVSCEDVDKNNTWFEQMVKAARRIV